jgi:hypothetical protein
MSSPVSQKKPRNKNQLSCTRFFIGLTELGYHFSLETMQETIENRSMRKPPKKDKGKKKILANIETSTSRTEGSTTRVENMGFSLFFKGISF